jgi:hypothetical protein
MSYFEFVATRCRCTVPSGIFPEVPISINYSETGDERDSYSIIDRKDNRSLGYIESLDVSSNSISFHDFLSR